MQLNKKLQKVKPHIIGSTYKLWNLPIGSTVKRHNFMVKDKEVRSFKIIEQLGSISWCKTNWGGTFHLDASLEASLIKIN